MQIEIKATGIDSGKLNNSNTSKLNKNLLFIPYGAKVPNLKANFCPILLRVS